MSIEEGIMARRAQIKSDGEPLFTERRSVRSVGSGGELILNVPETAVELLDLDTDSNAVIQIYEDGYRVRFDP